MRKSSVKEPRGRRVAVRKLSPALPEGESRDQLATRAGLGAAAAIETLNVLRERHKLAVIRKWLDDLSSFEEKLKTIAPLNRSNAIALLQLLRDLVSELTDETTGRGEIRIASHSTTLIDSIIGQLEDLKNGRVGDLFRPVEGIGGASFKFEERRTREMALTLVAGVRSHGTTLQDAYKQVASSLKRAGLKYRGEPISAKLIHGWWKNSPK